MKRISLEAFKRRKIISVALLFSLLAAVYWLVLASDRYVSTAHVIIQRTDLPGAQSMDFGSLVAGVSGTSNNRADHLLLRDHLLSVDMMQKLEQQLGLRAHYSGWHDPLSRMWSAKLSTEWFHKYYLRRVSVELDEYSGVLVVNVEAFEPAMAHALATRLVQEGEQYMNRLAQQLAQAQVTFLEGQVAEMNARTLQTRRQLLAFQNKKGLVSPKDSAISLGAIVARLEAQRAELQIQRNALQSYLVADHPSILMLNQQIVAVERQLASEQAKLAAPSGSTLNSTVEEFQRLEMEAAFAQQVYQTALGALEKGRIEALRTIKKVQVLQAPTQPEYPLEPKRVYNTIVFVLGALLLAGVAHLVLAVVKDHQD